MDQYIVFSITEGSLLDIHIQLHGLSQSFVIFTSFFSATKIFVWLGHWACG